MLCFIPLLIPVSSLLGALFHLFQSFVNVQKLFFWTTLQAATVDTINKVSLRQMSVGLHRKRKKNPRFLKYVLAAAAVGSDYESCATLNFMVF